MSTKLDQMFSYADYLFQLSQKDLTQIKTKDHKQINNNNKSIDEKLLDLIIEEKSKSYKFKNQSDGSFVLKKLVAKEKQNHLVINLFAGNDGYSVGLKLNDSESLIETMRLPYEENQLLDYIDNEELPPFLVDLIENSPLINSNLFQSGCLIVEVRDYRRSATTHSHHYSSNWVLLRPTTQSLTNDLINIINTTSNEYLWTDESKAELEAQLILATAPKLCLDPNPTVGILSNKLWRKKQMFKEKTFSKLSKRCSQIAVNRVKKFESMAAPKSLRLHEFLKKRNNKSSSQTKINKMIHFNINEPTVEPIPVKSIGVEKFAKMLPKPQISALDNSLIKVEEYKMDFMDDNRRSLTHVTILHRPNDDTYFGQLYIDKQGQIRGSTCTFQLGTKQATKRYIDQFTEILTENGRKSVKIIHQIPGQDPQVSYTPAATATGMTTTATKDPLEDEGMNLGTTTPKKCKLTAAVEHSPPLNSSVLQSPIISPTSSASVTPKPMETLSIPAVFSPPSKSSTDSTSPLLTSGIHATTGPTTIAESALAVILTPSTGIAKSLQQIDTSETTHQSITTSTPLPTGVSLTSLSLAPVQQNLRLHNLVSLTPQGLAVPISLTMMPTPSGPQPSIMTTPGSMIVSLDQTQQKDDDNVTVTYAATPTTVLMSTGSAGSNVLSVPIGMAGSLGVHQLNAQFITNQLKQSTGQIRATTPQVSLLQMSNTPTVPILRPLAPHTYAPTSSSTTFSQIQSSNTLPIAALTPQQQLANVLRKQAQQQQIQIATQKNQRKRQTKR